MPLPVAAVAVVSWVQMWVAVVAVAVVPAVLVVAMEVMQGLGEALTLALQAGVAAVGVAWQALRVALDGSCRWALQDPFPLATFGGLNEKAPKNRGSTGRGPNHTGGGLDGGKAAGSTGGGIGPIRRCDHRRCDTRG